MDLQNQGGKWMRGSRQNENKRGFGELRFLDKLSYWEVNTENNNRDTNRRILPAILLRS